MYAVRHESLQDAIVRIDSKAIYAQTMATLGRFGILENCTRDEESQSAFESTDIYSAGSTNVLDHVGEARVRGKPVMPLS